MYQPPELIIQPAYGSVILSRGKLQLLLGIVYCLPRMVMDVFQVHIVFQLHIRVQLQVFFRYLIVWAVRRIPGKIQGEGHILLRCLRKIFHSFIRLMLYRPLAGADHLRGVLPVVGRQMHIVGSVRIPIVKTMSAHPRRCIGIPVPCP